MLGAFMGQLIMPSSPLKALQAAGPAAKVDFDSGYYADSAAAVAAHFDVVIVFATQWLTEAFDAGSLSLPEGQDDLIKKVARANSNTIVVLETGNPVRMPWLPQVKAVLEAWYPGQEGGRAISDVLTGAVNPSGRLPITFPTDEQQNSRPVLPGLGLPEGTNLSVDYAEGSDVGYRWFASKNIAPLFPFGYGLSFTTFANTGLNVANAKTLEASVNVKNTGARPGATVTQIYLLESAGHTKKRLVAFTRQELSPGESRDVKMSIDPRLLANWDNIKKRWQIDSGKYVLAVTPPTRLARDAKYSSARSQSNRESALMRLVVRISLYTENNPAPTRAASDPSTGCK
jgi:beta-glucosidase